MTEKYIEQKLVKAVKKRGGMALKFVSPGLDGVPDRIVLLPMGRIAFVELKAPGRKMRPLQVRRKRQLLRWEFTNKVLTIQIINASVYRIIHSQIIGYFCFYIPFNVVYCCKNMLRKCMSN